MNVHPEHATPDDVPAIHALRRSLEEWMAARGIDQWPVGSVPLERIAAQVAAGDWWVVRDDAGVRGSLRVIPSDPEYWGDDDTPALYVHGLMVARRATGTGLGRALVEWAGQRARDAGATWLRLDHRASNPHLDDLYRSWGFEAVDVTGRPGFEVVLMQRAVAQRPSSASGTTATPSGRR
ncbi:GNAT family N-acetyltransferase [Cellulomonas flavigena]|uniref:GNAT family N-acetyltransferase n=1 Tax=Cellulomonas flavigena TaxID=1711 RepID=UPI001FE21A9F|nr:GNAT family N-acetyltransferase [Cellulomonas flavigena]